MDKKPLIIAGIPAFNEEDTIAKVVLLAKKHVDSVIVCDDGSTDMTAEIAEKLSAEVIRLNRNVGYGAAILMLLKRARELDADVMVTLDADLQHNPNDIPALVKPILESVADVVVGSRFLEETKAKAVPMYRRLGIKAITRLTNIFLTSEIKDAQSGFRAYSRNAIRTIRLTESRMGGSVEILLRAKEFGLKIVEAPVGCRYQGLEKTSTHNPLLHGTSVIMSILRVVVEDRPLLFLGAPGAVALLVGVFFGVWMLQLYAIERRIVTNIALASMAFVLIGLFCVSTAITLYALLRLTRKTAGPNV